MIFDMKMILTDVSTGEEIEIYYLDTIIYEGKEYDVFMVPDSDGKILILQIVFESSVQNYISVNDEEICNKIFDIFIKRNKATHNFVDDK